MRVKGIGSTFIRLAAALALVTVATPAAAWRTGPFIIYFGYDSESIDPPAAAILDNLARELATFPEAHIVLQGHTDRTGAAAGNVSRSCRRARAAQGYLLAKGVAATRMVVQGRGESDPLVDTDDGVREPQNRRVAFVFGTAAEIEAARADPHRC